MQVPIYLLIIDHFFVFFSFQLSRSIVSSTLTAVTDNSTVIEGSSESSSNVTVVVIDSDSKTPEPGTHSRSPSVER